MSLFRFISSSTLFFVLAFSGILSRGDQPKWAWTGAVSPTSATLKTGWSDAPPTPLQLSTQPGLSPAKLQNGKALPAGVLGEIVTYELQNLQPDTVYYYGWEGQASGQFRTFPSGKADIVFAFASCAKTGSSHPVFESIAEQNPLFFLHTGDLHYEDIRKNDVEIFREAYSRVFSSPQQNACLRKMPWIYMWDDHDYGPNNSNASSPSRPAAMQSYRETVPHYPLALGTDPDKPVAQAFTVGRVRFILTDLRSAKQPRETMMGEEQLEWFTSEVLRSHRSHAMVVWLSSVPWISPKGSSRDNWGGFPDERQEISDFLTRNRITNFFVISGDAHMLAFDDGSNNTYASNGKGPGFPVFQAGALDQRGSVKGGPYSGGTHPGPGHFGLIRIFDQGDAVRVEFEGRTHTGEILLTHTFSRAVEGH